MEQNTLFFSLAVFLPTFLMLYSLGNIVFVMGEFKEKFSKIPRLLLMMFTKLVVLLTVLLFSLHYHFDDVNVPDIKIPLFLSGIYTCFELYITNKIVHSFSKYGICRFSSKEKFKRYTKFTTQNIFKFEKVLFVFVSVLLLVTILTSLIVSIFFYSTLILSILILLILLFYMKICILKYLKSL